MKNILLMAPVFLLFSGTGVATAHGEEPAIEEKSASSEPGEETLVTLQAPLFSPLFSETPVALVNEEPITFRDLTAYIASAHTGRATEATSAGRDYADLLERVVTTELIVQEARNIGFDELPDFEAQVEAFSTDLLISRLMSRHLETVEADPEEVEDLYRTMSREFLLSTMTFEKEADAAAFKEQTESGEDFAELASRFADEGRGEMESGEKEYVKLKDLLPRIAEAAYAMEVDEVSQIFSAEKGFLVFRVEDVGFYEDADLKEEARRMILEGLKKKAAREYADSLQEKHSTIDHGLLEKADFEKEKAGFLSLGEEKPVDFRKFTADERVVATVHSDPPSTVTVGDLARQVEQGLYHGAEKAIGRKEGLNEKKEIKLRNTLFKRNAILEARIQGLDETEEYSDAVEGFESSLLFDTFIQRVVSPDVKLTEDQLRKYYTENVDEFSSPKMFRMNGLAFHGEPDAERALDRLRKGADFRWVSANSAGQVEPGTEGVLDFRNALLSLTALPEDLQQDADRANRGGSLLYSPPKGYHYVVVVEDIFPPRPQEYEKARQDIAKTLFEEEIRVLVDDWSEKLKEAYETRIFVTGSDD
jgi:hypothetical protein